MYERKDFDMTEGITIEIIRGLAKVFSNAIPAFLKNNTKKKTIQQAPLNSGDNNEESAVKIPESDTYCKQVSIFGQEEVKFASDLNDNSPSGDEVTIFKP